MNGQYLGNEKAFFQQAIEDINQWALKNNHNLSKMVDFELVQVYLKAVQKLSPKGVIIGVDGQRLCLYFTPVDKKVKKACDEEHEITIKTADRICRPMIHPDYPNLINDLEIKDSSIELPVCTPSGKSESKTIKEIYVNRMRANLADYVKQCGIGFTQTHALGHLCNFHGKLIGLTEEQRATSLGHSETMNRKYNKHLDTASKADFLLRTIDTPAVEIARLKQKNQQLEEENEFLKREIANLKSLLINSSKVVKLSDKR